MRLLIVRLKEKIIIKNNIVIMKKKFILTKKQLEEFVENKKNEKVFYDIVETIYKNNKFLNENISKKNIKQNIIDLFSKNNLINSKVKGMLTKFGIINENNQIL